MRFHVISDNEDTLVGLRLAGIDGVIVHNEEEAQQEINKAMAKADEKIAPAIEGMQLVKELYVPGKLVNLVVKP